MVKPANMPGTSIVLNLKDNSEKEAILKAISSSGEFNIQSHDAEGTVILYLKRSTPQRPKKLDAYCFRKPTKFKIFRKKRPNLVEHIAKSQGITLATSDSTGAIGSGVIV